MMKYTKTHVHKNILGWAGLDLNDVEFFFFLISLHLHVPILKFF
jgi:hypothetical protein